MSEGLEMSISSICSLLLQRIWIPFHFRSHQALLNHLELHLWGSVHFGFNKYLQACNIHKIWTTMHNKCKESINKHLKYILK